MVKLLDANIIIRFILWPSEALFGESKDIFRSIQSDDIEVIINDVVISEVLYVLTGFYKYDRSAAAIFLKDILLMDGIKNPDQLIIIQALSLCMDTVMDFADCLLLATARISNYEVLTFDKEMLRYISKTL
jgi:predicted nucleic-acid-binding protein